MSQNKNWWKVAMNEAKYFCQLPPPSPSPVLFVLVCLVRTEEITVRLHHVSPSHIWLCHANGPWRDLRAGTDLDTARLRRRRGRTAPSRSWRRCRRSWRGRDQCSLSTSEFQAGSPTCPREPCRPSPSPTRRGPGPGGMGSSWMSGPSPGSGQPTLGQEGCYYKCYFLSNKILWFSHQNEKKNSWLNCPYLRYGGNVILK